MAALAPAHTAAIWAAPWTADKSKSDAAGAPDVGVAAVTTPVGDPGVQVGRYSDMMVAMVCSTMTMESSPQ